VKPVGATRLTIIPCELAEANAFVLERHRHLGPVVGHRFSLAVADPAGQVRGVAIVGRPIGRFDEDGFTLQLVRSATDGHPNAASALLGACRRAAFALGYRRIITFNLQEESGASLRGAGFVLVGERPGRTGWDCPMRPRIDKAPKQRKFRWEALA
jgi:hypothetical protein